MIPFLDLGAATAELRPGIDAAIARVLSSGWYIGGEEVDGFEAEFAAYTGAGHCVGTNSGLDALTLTLNALGIGPGDEVIVPAHTFVATWLAVTATGARPVPVEPEPEGFNIDPAGLEAAVTVRTRAVIPVHLYGRPANLRAIRAFAARHGLAVVEDAAQAHGATWDGRRIGGGSTAACWSFYPAKNLGALGDGGAVTTDDPDLAARIRRRANYGSARKYHHELQGANSRLDPVQAAVLRVKLPHLDAWNDRRRRIAASYDAELAETGLSLPDGGATTSVWHLFVVRSPDRDRLQERLRRAGVQTQIHYPVPPHLQPAYADLGMGAGTLPRTEAMAREILSLPIGPHMSDAQTDAVISAVTAHVRSSALTAEFSGPA